MPFGFGAGLTTGNVVGPLLGGFVVTLGDWHLFFLANALLAGLSGLLVQRILAKERLEMADERVGIAGMVVLSVAILSGRELWMTA